MKKLMSMLLSMAIILSSTVGNAFAYVPTDPDCYDMAKLLNQSRWDEKIPCKCKTCSAILFRYDDLSYWENTGYYDKYLKNAYTQIWENNKSAIKYETVRNASITAVSLDAIVYAVLALMAYPITKLFKGVSICTAFVSVASGGFFESKRIISVNGKKLSELEIELTNRILKDLSKLIENKRWKGNNYLQITINRDPIHPDAHVQFANYPGLDKFYKEINIEKTMNNFNTNLKKIIKDDNNGKYDSHLDEVYDPWWYKASQISAKATSGAAVLFGIALFFKKTGIKPDKKLVKDTLSNLGVNEEKINDVNKILDGAEKLSTTSSDNFYKQATQYLSEAANTEIVKNEILNPNSLNEHIDKLREIYNKNAQAAPAA